MNQDCEQLNSAAAEIFWATLGDDAETSKRSSKTLLQLAVRLTAFVEDAAIHRPDLLKDASKDYPCFPVLLSSASGRDTKQKLNLINALPIGANYPFKPLRGVARNDDLRCLIETFYWSSNPVRLGLPPPSKATARQWAAAIVEHYDQSEGGDELMTILGINGEPSTATRQKRRRARILRKFGGYSVRTETDRDGSRFFTEGTQGGHVRELESIEATQLDIKRSETDNLRPTRSGRLAEFIDKTEKRLVSILKM